MAPTRSPFPQSRTVVLVVDVINRLDFPGGRSFGTRAMPTIRAIGRLVERARGAGVPVVFVNDNFGRWRSDIERMIASVSAPGCAGGAWLEILRPSARDFVVLKSTLSGFYQTPLEAMLRQGGVTTVVITGVVTGNCVLFTAADAYMRGFTVVVPGDCVDDLSRRSRSDGLRRIRALLKARIAASRSLKLRR